jgi:gluconate 2-dehydrogenase gamma chain
MPEETSVAGQGFQRREILRVMGAAAIASHFPGFSRWSYAAAHAPADGTPPRPAAYAPQFFTAAEFAVITRLTELIIPSDGTPGAREAGVDEFVDFMVAHDAQLQPRMRAGIEWLQARCQRDHSLAFVELSEAAQTALLEPLAFAAKHRAGDEVGQEFFRGVKDLTVMGFYSSEIGYHEIDNPGLHPWGFSPSCAHPDDPAHARLPAPRW